MKTLFKSKTGLVASATGLLILLLVQISVKAQEPVIGTNVGNIAPEINLVDPNGNAIALSSLKGQMVLIDFWASWCRPCRMENPNVVAAYQKYSQAKIKGAKGFTVYSVSLDRSKEAWQAAIQQDKLNWEYHVSDLKFWNSQAAADYRVTGIPTNFLIDKDGIIVAKNLRGPRLHTVLDKYVDKL